MCEKHDTSNQKPQRCVPDIGACSLQRRFADIQRGKFFSKSFYRNQNEKHLENWSGIVSFISLSIKRAIESRQDNSGS